MTTTGAGGALPLTDDDRELFDALISRATRDLHDGVDAYRVDDSALLLRAACTAHQGNALAVAYESRNLERRLWPNTRRVAQEIASDYESQVAIERERRDLWRTGEQPGWGYPELSTDENEARFAAEIARCERLADAATRLVTAIDAATASEGSEPRALKTTNRPCALSAREANAVVDAIALECASLGERLQNAWGTDPGSLGRMQGFARRITDLADVAEQLLWRNHHGGCGSPASGLEITTSDHVALTLARLLQDRAAEETQYAGTSDADPDPERFEAGYQTVVAHLAEMVTVTA